MSDTPARFPKRAYWIGVVLATLALVVSRFKTIWPGNLSYLDQGLLIFLGLVLLLPLVSEFEGFGFKVTSSLEQLKSEVNRKLGEIRNAIQNNIRIENRFGPSEPAVLAQIGEQIAKEVGEAKIQRPHLTEILREVPPEHLELFGVRYAIERELNRLAGKDIVSRPNWGRRMRELMIRLAEAGHILRDTPGAYAELRRITNRATHGAEVTPEEIEFVRTTAPAVLASLQRVPTPPARAV